MNGWIKLHRKLTEWEWYNDVNVFKVFVHILLKASFKPATWQGKTVMRGQLITSRDHLAKETGLSVRQVRTALDKLKTSSNLTIKTTNKYTLITVENYTFYQDSTEESDQQNDQQRVTQTTTSLEVKEPKNKNTGIPDEIQELWKAFPGTKGKADFVKKMPKLIKDHSFDVMMQCIQNYKDDVEADRKRNFDRAWMQGGTFVNGKYQDYLPENYNSKKAASTDDINELALRIINGY